MKVFAVCLVLLCNLAAANIYADSKSDDKKDEIVGVAMNNLTHSEGVPVAVRILRSAKIENVRAAVILLKALSSLNDSDLNQRVQYTFEAIESILKNIELSRVAKENLRNYLFPIFSRYSLVDSDRNLIIDLYEKYQLWSREEFWFLIAQASNSELTIMYFRSLIIATPHMNKQEHVALKSSLQRSKPDTLPSFLIQYQLGFLARSQMKPLLLKMAQAFKPLQSQLYRVARHRRETLDVYLIGVRRAAVDILEDIQSKINQGDPAFLNLLATVTEKAPDPEVKVFFQMFNRNGFSLMHRQFPGLWDWTLEDDPLNLDDQVSKRNLAEPRGTVIYRTDKVVQVAFGPRKNGCNEALKHKEQE
jgi:hypothetical protein